MPDDSKKKSKHKWIWYVAGGVAVIVVYLYYRNYENNAAATTAADELAAEPSGATAGDTGSDTPTTPAPISITSFEQWEQQAEQWAVGNGQDAIATQNAIQAYSDGDCLTSAEYKIIDNLLAQFGLPPDAPTTTITICNNTPTTPPAKTTTTPTKPTTPAPSASGIEATLQDRINASAGQLSAQTGKVSSPTQVSTINASKLPAWLAPFGAIATQFWHNALNIGNISSQLSGKVNPAQITPLAQNLAEADGHSWASLNALEQNQYSELANLQLLLKANPK
jgi:hypothetical protein